MELREIIDGAVRTDSDLGELLRRCKALASRLGSRPLEDWLLWESGGYPERAELPDYRTWPLLIRGNFSGPFQSTLRNARIPLASLPASWRGRIDVARCRESVAGIRHLIDRTHGDSIHTDLGDLALVLGCDVIDGMNCISAWGEFHKSRLVEVLNSVRNRALDFALALSKEDPHAGESSGADSSMPSERITQIFRTTVYGGSANVVSIGDKCNVQLTIQSGDFEGLSAYLEQLGIGKDDVRALRAAVDEDPKPRQQGSLGPRVAAWVARMFEKAASGAWTIALSSAATVLTNAVERYYGLR